ncbi:hypothetical protein [uncultured Lacinutrix sp.]|uniref:hypothetical protein n=1 Tax=uncultured Lacinutrix sp. TaxID=574032 RepID=UPI002623FA76|nr:hypothetical protein [uncultured Lacinutrix sp.]
MKKQTLFIVTLLFTLVLQAQVGKSTFKTLDLSKFPMEKTQLSTNTNLVLVGEHLYYKLFVLSNGKLSNISKIAYVELIDANNKSIHKHILNLKNGAASNRIFIPTQLKTGQYKLLAYTNWSKNNTDKSYFSKDIYVVNAFSNENQIVENSTTTVKLEKTETLQTNTTNNKNIIINTSKQSYNNREHVKIDIITNENYKDGNYSLSVNKVDSISMQNVLDDSFITNKTSNTLFIPEMRGQLITGKITNVVNALDLNEKNIALSIPGEQFIFKIAETNPSGYFFFNLDTKINSNIATFQVIGDTKENFKIDILNNFETNYKDLSFNNLELDNTLKYTLEQRNIKNQIENAYYQNKKDSILSLVNSKSFFKTKEKTYVLDEYTRFKTVRETFIEVLKEAGLRKEGDSYKIIVYDFYDKKKGQDNKNMDPLVIVDGMIVQNNNDLINYDPYKIESIDLVIGEYLYGSKLYQGIISVNTITKDFKTSLVGDFIIDTTLNLPEDEIVYFQPQYPNSTKNKHIPDYRRQLLWISETNLNNDKNHFTTYTSDDKGTYKITIEGYSANGEFIKSTSYFTVN